MLAAALNEALADPTVKSRIIEVGAIPEASTLERYGKMIADDQKRWGDIVRKLGLTAEQLAMCAADSFPAVRAITIAATPPLSPERTEPHD